MQFREFGEWITRIANMHDPIKYVLLVSPQRTDQVVDLLVDAGVEDRFVCYELPALTPGRMMVIAEPAGNDLTVSIDPLVDALNAAIRADLKSQLIDDGADRMLEDRPFVMRFDSGPPELESAATHPEGESPGHETGG